MDTNRPTQFERNNCNLAFAQNWEWPVSKTVLIVEDNELNMKLFHDLLEAHGYSTIEARTGPEALKLAAEHRPDRPDSGPKPVATPISREATRNAS